MHTIFVPGLNQSVTTFRVEGDEARHATRVKRLGVGDAVRVLNGEGTMFLCAITDAGRSLELSVREREALPRTAPVLRVRSATPKGPRLEKMIDQLSQIGAASWSPLATDLGVVEPGDHKIERVQRIAVESAKQCARAWTLEIEARVSFAEALQAGTVDLVIASADAPPYASIGRPEIHLFVGPEGGFTQRELEQAHAAGVRVASFGPHIMRIETAAAVAAGIILNAERPHHPAYAHVFDPELTEGDER